MGKNMSKRLCQVPTEIVTTQKNPTDENFDGNGLLELRMPEFTLTRGQRATPTSYSRLCISSPNVNEQRSCGEIETSSAYPVSSPSKAELRVLFSKTAMRREDGHDDQSGSDSEEEFFENSDFEFDIPDPCIAPLKRSATEVNCETTPQSMGDGDANVNLDEAECDNNPAIQSRAGGDGDKTSSVGYGKTKVIRKKIVVRKQCLQVPQQNRIVGKVTADTPGQIKEGQQNPKGKKFPPSKLPKLTPTATTASKSAPSRSKQGSKVKSTPPDTGAGVTNSKSKENQPPTTATSSKNSKKLVVRGLKKFVESHGGNSHPPSWVRDFPIKSKYHADNYIYDWEEGPKQAKRPPPQATANCTKRSGRCDACGIYSVDTCRCCRKCQHDCSCPKPPTALPDLTQALGPGWTQAQKVVCELANGPSLTQDERRAPIGRNPGRQQFQEVEAYHHVRPQFEPQPHLKCQIDVLNPSSTYSSAGRDYYPGYSQYPSYNYYTPQPPMFPSYYSQPPPPTMYPYYAQLPPQPFQMMYSPPPPNYFSNPYSSEPPRNYY